MPAVRAGGSYIRPRYNAIRFSGVLRSVRSARDADAGCGVRRHLFLRFDASVQPSPKARQFFIHGVTKQGRRFRPSDWAERLCSALAPYRPGGVGVGRDALIGYSPYVRPEMVGDMRCVVVDERLKEVEVLAFEFAMNFARDNDLPVTEGCLLPEPAAGKDKA